MRRLCSSNLLKLGQTDLWPANLLQPNNGIMQWAELAIHLPVKHWIPSRTLDPGVLDSSREWSKTVSYCSKVAGKKMCTKKKVPTAPPLNELPLIAALT